MFKKIPFYGKKDTIESIKKIGNNYYEVSIYNKEGITNKTKVITTEEQMTNNYLNAIEAYLFNMKDKYKEAKELIESKTIKNNCIKMLIASIIVGLGLPTIGYLMNSAIAYYGGFVITGIMCVPTFFYSIKELICKSSENEIKKSIKEYEDLTKEKEIIKTNIENKKINKEPTKYNEIKPMKHENIEKTKQLIKEKE